MKTLYELYCEVGLIGTVLIALASLVLLPLQFLVATAVVIFTLRFLGVNI